MTSASRNDSPGWIAADWPAPTGVRAGCSTRTGGMSQAAYTSLNLAAHVGDSPRAVAENRRRLAEHLRLPAEPAWLDQRHGSKVIAAHAADSLAADAAWTDRPGVVCAVLTADCLPLLLCDRDGSRVAAIHVGWRGLTAGIVSEALAKLGHTDDLLAWIGPCIGPQAYEVGADVYQACRALGVGLDGAFVPGRRNHWLASLPELVRRLLSAHGVTACHGGIHCTFTDSSSFYSYRRDGVTGRMASLIWIDA